MKRSGPVVSLCMSSVLGGAGRLEYAPQAFLAKEAVSRFFALLKRAYEMIQGPTEIVLTDRRAAWGEDNFGVNYRYCKSYTSDSAQDRSAYPVKPVIHSLVAYSTKGYPSNDFNA